MIRYPPKLHKGGWLMAEDDKTDANLLSKAWIGAYLVGVPYLIGYLVVTIHLATYSLLPLEVIRIQYVVAGIWSIVPLVIILYPLTALVATLHDEYRGGKIEISWRALFSHLRRIVQSLISSFGICMGLLFTFKLVTGGLDFSSFGITIRDGLTFLEIVLLFACVIAAFVSGTWLFWRDVEVGDIGASFNDLIWGTTFALLACAAGFFYILFFATHVYGKIPSFLGGGAAVPVSIYLKHAETGKLQQENEGLESGSYYLLTTTEHSFFLLRLNSKRAIEVSRESVEAVSYGVSLDSHEPTPSAPGVGAALPTGPIVPPVVTEKR
jgi:hypothetical protein